MESLGMKVLSVGLVLAAAGASLESQLWLKAKLNATTLSAGKVTNVGPLPSTICAIHARRTPSAALFCHDQGQCFVSDLKIAGHRDDSLFGPGPVLNCWTKYACVLDGVGYVEDENFTYHCLPMKCVNSEIVNKTEEVLSPCVAPFQYYPCAGCFYLLNQEMTWSQARTTCIQLGGDLAMPANFTAFHLYIESFGEGYSWLGGICKEWLNGTVVADNLFYGSRGNGTCQECITYRRYYHIDHYHYGLTAKTCSEIHRIVCEIKV